MSNQPSTYVPTDANKIADWQKAWGDFLVIHTQSMGRLHQAIAEDYAAYDGRLDSRSFQYITEQYGLRTPAKLVSYPLLNRMVNFLVNKTQGDSIDVGVECIDETIISEKQDKIARAAAEMLLRPLRRQMEQEIKTKIPDDMVNAPVPADPEEFMQIDWKSEQEVGIQWAMRYMSLTYNLDQLFQEGMKDMAICYKELYEVCDGDRDPHIRRVDPRSVRFGAAPGVSWLQDCQWVVDEELLPINVFAHRYRKEIQENPRFYDEMAAEIGGTMNSSWTYNSYLYGDQANGRYVRVVRYKWIAVRSLNMKYSPNAYVPDTPYIKRVGSNAGGDNVVTYPVEDVYEGVWACGYHLRCGRMVNQVRRPGNYARASHGYVGCIKDTMSLPSTIQNLLRFYYIVMYHIEAMMNRAGGKAMVYDMAQKPANIPTQEIFYHAKEGGLILINSAQEGNHLLNRHSFNQFQSVDFTLSNSLGQLLTLKQVIEQTAEKFVGMNDAVLAQSKADEAVGLNESKIEQSSIITSHLFDDHDFVIEQVFTEVLGKLKYHWPKDKEKVLRLFGERGLEIYRFRTDWLGYAYGVYIKNKRKEREQKRSIQAAARQSHVSGQLDILDLLKIQNATNSKEMERMFKVGVNAMRKLQQQQAEAQNAELKRKNDLDQLGIQSRIEAARIEAQAYVETQKMKMAMDREGNIRDNMTLVNKVAQESRDALVAPSTAIDQPQQPAIDPNMQQ